ncbi:MAG: mandelate racemase/muconate lactonizing enzyme family protein [Actinomycetes bacterium]
MKIESVDLFYVRMPEVLDIGDGSQDGLIARVRAGSFEGWGEAVASPVTSIASWIAPMSHSGCHPVIDSVMGETLDSPSDIARIARKVRSSSFYGIIQSDLTFSGIEIALWDLLGHAKEEPIYKLLGYKKAERKLPYASVLFGDTPEETKQKAVTMRGRGFSAIKFGWGPYGRTTVEVDASHVHAAREGIGADGHLMIDAGTVFGEDVDAAALRIPALAEANVKWYEEPVEAAAFSLYKKLSLVNPKVLIAGGEGAHNFLQAQNLIDHGGVGFIQIDTGYVGGIGSAYRVAQYAQSRGIQYINHTFTSQSALAASLHPFAGLKDSWMAEYPMEPKTLCQELTVNNIPIDSDGMISVNESPGLGIQFNTATVKKYLVNVEIKVENKVLYKTPAV